MSINLFQGCNVSIGIIVILLRDGGWAGHGDPQSSCAFTFLFTVCHGSFYVHSKFVIPESSIRAQRLGTVVLRVDFVFVFPVSPETGSLQNRVDDLVLILSSTSRNKCDEYISMFPSKSSTNIFPFTSIFYISNIETVGRPW